MLVRRFVRYTLVAALGWTLPSLVAAQNPSNYTLMRQPSSASIVKQEAERVLAEKKRQEAASQAAKNTKTLGEVFRNLPKTSSGASSNMSKSTAPVKQPQLMTTKPARELGRLPEKPYAGGSFTGSLSQSGKAASNPAGTSSKGNNIQPSTSPYPVDKNCWDPLARTGSKTHSPGATIKQRPVWNHVERQGKSIDDRCWVPSGRISEAARPWLCAPQTGELIIRVNTQFCRPDYYKQYAVTRSFGYCYEGFYHNHWQTSRWNADHQCWMHFDRGVNSWYYWCAPDRCYYPVNYKPYNSFTCENVACNEQEVDSIPPMPGRDD